MQNCLHSLRKDGRYSGLPQPPAELISADATISAMLELGSDGWRALVALLFKVADSAGADEPAGDALAAAEEVPILLGAVGTLGDLDEDTQVAMLGLHQALAPYVRECASALRRGATGHGRARVTATAPPLRAVRAGASAASAANDVLRHQLVAESDEQLLQLACADGRIRELSALAAGGGSGARVHARTVRALLRLVVRLRHEDGDAAGVSHGADVLDLIATAASDAGAGSAAPSLNLSVRVEALRRAADLLRSSTLVSVDGLSPDGVCRAVQQLIELAREQSVTLAAGAKLALPRLLTRLLQLGRAGAPHPTEVPLLHAACQALPQLKPLAQGKTLPADLNELQCLLRPCGEAIERLIEWLGGSESGTACDSFVASPRRALAEALLWQLQHSGGGPVELLRAALAPCLVGGGGCSLLGLARGGWQYSFVRTLFNGGRGDSGEDDEDSSGGGDSGGSGSGDGGGGGGGDGGGGDGGGGDDSGCDDDNQDDETRLMAMGGNERRLTLLLQLPPAELHALTPLVEQLCSGEWGLHLNAFAAGPVRRVLAEARLHLHAGNGLLAFLHAVRDDPSLGKARANMLSRLLHSEPRGDDGEEPEADDDDAGRDGAAPSLYGEMQGLQGEALEAVCQLLQLLATSERFKPGFQLAFKRLMNVGQTERHLIAQIAATRLARQDGSAVHLPQNVATLLMLQDLTDSNNWTYPVRQVVYRYDLVRKTADICKSTSDLSSADARHLHGEHTWPATSPAVTCSPATLPPPCTLSPPSHCYPLPMLTRSLCHTAACRIFTLALPLLVRFHSFSSPLEKLRMLALEMYCDAVSAGSTDTMTQACLRSLGMQQMGADGSGADASWLYLGGVNSVQFLTKVLANAGMLPQQHCEPEMRHPMRNPLAPSQRDVIGLITLFPTEATGFYAMLQPLPVEVQRPIAECARATRTGKQANWMARVAAGGAAPNWVHELQVEALRRCPADCLVEVSDPSELACQRPAPPGCLHSQGYLTLCDYSVAALEAFEHAGRLYHDRGPGVEVPDVCELPLHAPLAAGPLRSRRASDAGSGEHHMFPKTPRGGCELNLQANPNPNPDPNPSQPQP